MPDEVSPFPEAPSSRKSHRGKGPVTGALVTGALVTGALSLGLKARQAGSARRPRPPAPGTQPIQRVEPVAAAQPETRPTPRVIDLTTPAEVIENASRPAVIDLTALEDADPWSGRVRTPAGAPAPAVARAGTTPAGVAARAGTERAQRAERTQALRRDRAGGDEPALDSFFLTPVPDPTRDRVKPRTPLTPFRGFRQPTTRPPRRSRLPLLAGTLAVLLVLCGVAVGVEYLNSDRAPDTGGAASAAAAAGVATTGNGLTGAGTSPDAVSPTVTPLTTPSATAKPAAEPKHTGAKVKLGVFRGTDSGQVRAFGDWLGREPDYAVDFSSRGTWDEIVNPAYMINHWRGSDYQLVYSVALLPYHGETSIKAGSKGSYDNYFRTLARNLVAGGQQDVILRLGWEFNLKGWRWSTDNPDEFISYWRHIVKAMRSVPGADFKFDWNPNIGRTPYDATLYYPGGKYVDYVGVDVYDVSWDPVTYPYGNGCGSVCRLDRQERVWDRLYSGPYGLLFWSDFAHSKGKPMSIPEWGQWQRADGHGGGDNPYFIEQMHAFIDDPSHGVAYQAYLEVDVEDGQHRLTTLKNSGKMYKKLFGKK